MALLAAAAALIAKSIKSEPIGNMSEPIGNIIATMAGLALLASFFIAIKSAYWILLSIEDRDA
jgi:hypothetical protein